MNTRTSKQLGVFMSIILGILFFPAFSAFAQDREGREFDKKGWEEKVNQMYDKLDLSEEQRQALKEHKQGHREEMKSLKSEIQAKREALQAEMQKGDFSADKVKAINDELKTLQNKMSDQRLEGILEVREILTPEQFSKFNELKESHHDQRKNDGDERQGPFKERLKDRPRE